MTKQIKKRKYTPTWQLFAFLILIFSAIFLLIVTVNNRLRISQHPVSINKIAESKGMMEASFIINEITNDIRTNSELSSLSIHGQRFRLWWLSDDNWNIIVEKGKNVSFELNSTNMSNDVVVKKNIAKIFHSLVRTKMIKNGLMINQKNSSASEMDDKFYDYVQAYEGNSVICTALTNGDVFRLEVYCSDVIDYKSAYSLQIPFLKGLGMKGEKGGSIDGIQIKNNIVAVMNIRGRRTGATAFMYRPHLDWQKIIITQAVPLCNVFVEKNIPEKFWTACFDEEGKRKSEGSAWK